MHILTFISHMLTIGKGCSGPMKTAFVWLTIYG